MNSHLSQELLRLREQSRQALEASWTRIEELQKELDETNTKLRELERQIVAVRMMRSSFLSESMKLGIRSGDSSGADSLRRGSMGSSVAMQHRGSVGSNVPQAPKVQQRGSLGSVLKRFSTGGKTQPSVGVDDVRINLMYQEREEKIKELNDQIAKKEEELAELQDKTSKQQETIQRLNVTLEELEAPHLCKSLAVQLKQQKAFAEKLTEELSTAQNTLTDKQSEHQSLEEEWHDSEDRLADAEANSSTFLEQLQRKLRRYNEESAEAATKRTHMIQAAQESLEELRQDLLDYMGPDSCQDIIREVKSQFQGLLKKEEELATLLVDRIQERKELSSALDSLNTVHGAIRDLLKAMLTLANRIENLGPAEDTETPNHPHEAVQFVSYLQKQVSTVVQEITRNLEALVASKQDDAEEGCVRIECSKLTQTSDRLTYTIQAKTRQMLRTLPDADTTPKEESLEREEEVERVSPEMVARFQARVGQKEEELAALQQDIQTIETKTREDSERANDKADTLEDEIQFLLHGLDEKDRMIAAVSGVIDERRDAEASLLDEIDYLKGKGVVIEDED